jgi:hypothetical protein
MTAPREDGQGPRLAMKHALRHAGIKPSAVDYVNAHATSTPLGDAAENRAITRPPRSMSAVPKGQLDICLGLLEVSKQFSVFLRFTTYVSKVLAIITSHLISAEYSSTNTKLVQPRQPI